MEILMILIISLGAIAGITVLAISHSRMTKLNAERGWLVAAEANREIRTLLAARVSTLENRLQADSISAFAELQHIPDDLAKATYAEMGHQPYFSDSGINRDGSPVESLVGHSRADDLEGDNFEGPTVG